MRPPSRPLGAAPRPGGADHLGYLISGRMRLRMSDGRELDYQAGDLVTIPPNHSAWVVGNDPAVFLDFTGGDYFSKLS